MDFSLQRPLAETNTLSLTLFLLHVTSVCSGGDVTLHFYYFIISVEFTACLGGEICVCEHPGINCVPFSSVQAWVAGGGGG